MSDLPVMTQFRVERRDNGLVHLIFDCPGRTMNVFSDAAIDDLAVFARWLDGTDVAGVLIRSGKDKAFCAGADLGELGVAYDMIMAAPPRRRFDVAFAHFFRLSSAMRLLETAGKPVAVAIAGVALGGGCELALAAHYRVLTDDKAAAMGLPESLVGLLPGSGGTQRLPRLVGVEASLPILLGGARLAGQAALDAGLAHALAAPGDDAAVAEAWLLSRPDPRQPWDRDAWAPASHGNHAAAIAAARARQLRETLGHYPAPLAILDCLEQGLVQSFDAAIRTEMAIFADLIMRPEPRDMIQTLFLGKTDYERAARRSAVPTAVQDAIDALAPRIAAAMVETPALARAGFGMAAGDPVRERTVRGYWIEDRPDLREAVAALARAAAPYLALSLQDRRMVDYALVTRHGFPAYLGGPLAVARANTP